MISTSGIYPNIDMHPTQVFDISPNYLEAMDNARFVRTCGLASLVFSSLSLLHITSFNIAVSIGIGMFMMWNDHDNYYRAAGIVAMIACSAFLPSLSPLLFSFAVLCRSREVLAALAEERRSQEDWPLTFHRARIGAIASATSVGINCSMLMLLAAGFLLNLWQ